MPRLLLIALLLSSFLLSACGNRDRDPNSQLLDFFNTEALPANEVLPDPDEVPYSEGPSEIPDVLIPNS